MRPKHLRAVSDAAPVTRNTPSNTEAELAMLGTLLLRSDVIEEVLSICQPQDMYVPRHSLIYQACIDLHKEGHPLDMISVGQRLRAMGKLEDCGGLHYLSSITDSVPFSNNAHHWAKIIADRATARRVLELGHEVVEKAYGEESSTDLLDFAEAQITTLRLAQFQGGGLRPISKQREAVWAEIEAAYRGEAGAIGIQTRLTDLDKLIGGLMRKDLIILGGRPSMGKTAIALQIATCASILAGNTTALFSLEMSQSQIYKRLLSNLARIPGDYLYGRKKLLTEHLPRLTQAGLDIERGNIHIDDQSDLSLFDIRSRLHRLRAELAREGKGLGLVIVDYLQIMGNCTDGENREREISERSSGLKRIAKDFDVPVIALSQLNRSLEKRPDKRPIMSDLRESGSLEQDADVIMFAYRDEVYNEDTEDRGVLEIIVGKQRNGPIGTARARFQKDTGVIEDLTPPNYDDPPGYRS